MSTPALAGEIYGRETRMSLKPLRVDNLEPGGFWVDYDQDTDSMVVFLGGKPRRGVSVYLDDDTYVIADPATGEIIGFQVDAWEYSFLPKHSDLQMVWPEIKRTLLPDEGWSELLKAYVAVAILILQQMFSSGNGTSGDFSMRPV